jgi:2-C-methyl-D-erythritol 4-phosphate cytidylyltransferase
VIHDGARPCITSDTIAEVVKQVRRNQAVVVGRKMTDTVKYVEKGVTVTRTEDRSKLWAVQTPQAFNYNLILKAYKQIIADKIEVFDDASALESIGEAVKIYESSAPNIKITTVDDLRLATALIVGK